MKKASEIDIKNIDTDSKEFQDALTLLTDTNHSVFLTGKAGTGKSTFLQYLTRTTKKKFVILAPTGIAAVNAGGQTLHSFFKIPFKPMLPDDPEVADSRRLKARMKYSKTFVKLLRSIDLIIIDEVSMVRADTIDFIDRLLKVYCGNFREPFAGKQLLLVGDVFQLEPVITGDIRDVLNYHYRDGAFFFNAKVFSDFHIVPIELKKVYRQNDADFISMLDRIRIGQPTVADIAALNAKVDAKATATDAENYTMTLATKRDIVDHINQSRLDSLPSKTRTFKGLIKGDFPENSLPTDLVLSLKIGAQVVFVKNDPERRWVNGSIGIITAFGEADITVQLEDGTKHAVTEDVWENVKYEYNEDKKEVIEKSLGSFVQYPLKLAWALTIHKSQGLTFDKVIIDIGQGAFSGGQTYVGLSRCRSLDGIKMRSTINQRDIFVNQRVVAFSRSFNNSSLISGALENARADTLSRQAAEAFNRGQYSNAVDLFTEALKYKNFMADASVVRLIKQKANMICSLQQRVTELEAEIDQNRRKFDSLATEYVDMAETCREEGWDMNAALSNYDKALSLSPDMALALIGKGKALAQMSEIDKAVDCFMQARKINDQDYRPLYEAGRLLVDCGDLAQGMEYLLHAMQRNEKSAIVHQALADGYEKAGDEDNAEKHRLIARKLMKKSK